MADKEVRKEKPDIRVKIPYFVPMRKLLLFFLCMISGFSAHAQKKLIQKLLSNQKDTTRKASFMPLPVIGYAQETGLELGLGALYAFYTDRKDTLTRSSQLYGLTSYSTEKTYNLTLKTDVWSPQNRYHYLGELRVKRMPFNFFGIGNHTREEDQDRLIQQLFKVSIEAEKNLSPATYTGLSLSFEKHRYTALQRGGVFESPEVLQRRGGQVVWAGVSQSYDTRDNNNYPTKGVFGRLSYQYAPPLFGSSHFSGGQLKLNLRHFWSPFAKVVWGTQLVYHQIHGSRIPFYLLPQWGNDELMRGYYTGRYRDQNLLATQTEIRYRFMNRFGIAAFAGMGQVYGKDPLSLSSLKPNYGLGGRYFFDTAKGLSVRLDYGVGEKRAGEKRQSGFYISLAEAF